MSLALPSLNINKPTPPPPPAGIRPPYKHNFIRSINLSHNNGLGHYVNSYMRYTPSQFAFMIVT